MATEVKVIKVRRGPYTDFDKTKMNAGEPAITTSGDPNALDGKGVYMGVGPGQVKQVAMIEDIEDILNNALDGAVDEATQQAKAEADRAEAAATQLASTVTQVATNTANISELNERINTEGFSNDARAALLNCFTHVAWIDEHGQNYYDTLYDALYPLTNLVRITAVFTQGSAVIYPTTPLNDLKTYLVVTGYYSNGRSAQITDYSLSGTLVEGTSTITVSVSNKTTTFDVIVSPPYWDYEWNASSRELPPDIVLESGTEYDFTTEPGALYIRKGFTLDFNYIGNCELVVELKCHTYHGGSVSPSIAVVNGGTEGAYNVGRILANRGENNAFMDYRISDNWVTSNANMEQWHEYNIKSENSVLSVSVDGTLLASGNGFTSTNAKTGVSLATYEVCYLKYIKFRRIQ